MKFAGHRSSKTLVGHYLSNISNVDGAAAFLGLDSRRDITEDFRSASMARNPGLQHSLPAKLSESLKQRDDYMQICEEIYGLPSCIKAAHKAQERQVLEGRQKKMYAELRKLREEELEKYKRSQKTVYNTESVAHDEGDWRRSYFDRVVRHMVPERDRLAETLTQAVALRSQAGLSALSDLVSLLRDDSSVAYQEALRPKEDRCLVAKCPLKISE